MSHGGERKGAGTSRTGTARSLALLLGLAAVIAWAAPARGGQDPIETLLPVDGSVPGWSRDGELQKFAGEDLYTYIDGGAEIYQEYGFRRVVLQDYQNAAGKSISLEIFEMQTPAAAYGVFTFKRSGKGKSVTLGSEAELEDYYLNFWKGPFLVTLTGFEEGPVTVAGVLAIGRAVDAKIGERGEVPDLVRALPKDGLRTGSVKYLKGLLGLNNVYPFYTARGLTFTEAVKVDYDDGSMLIEMVYPTLAALRAASEELGTFLDHSDKFKVAGVSPDRFYEDNKGRMIALVIQPLRLIFGIAPSADMAIERVRRAAFR